MVIGILDDPMAPPRMLADLSLGVTRTDQRFAAVAGWQISSLIKITPSMHEALGSRPGTEKGGAGPPQGKVPSTTVSSHSCCHPHLGLEGSPLKDNTRHQKKGWHSDRVQVKTVYYSAQRRDNAVGARDGAGRAPSKYRARYRVEAAA